ncbi:pyridoxal phosphate-dependent aminotransferase [Xinfangfangia pollutisoli]|uniref:pyridoxal phosphate-dependent aminotransferase n=1 Tax=Xinfangfangia pollutisoli TaxID=2865960 RepID=UPI001CD5B08E|nr:histidinol-phosphate transaminase [Xinfangfangia pollutisoli]
MTLFPQPYINATALSVTRKAQPAGDPSSWIQLSANESAFGASPLVHDALAKASQRPELYPEPSSAVLRKALSETFGFSPDSLICGNGSEAIIETIYRCYARPGDEVVFSRHSFIQFRIFADRVGAKAVLTDETDHHTDIDAILAAITPRTKIVVVANPNNPTGTVLPTSEIRRLRDALRPDIVLLLDSAYAEYVADPAYTAGHELVEGTENVIVTRTFSKAFGLAGLRVAWAHGPQSMIAILNRMRQIGNVGALAQAAAVAALQDMAFMRNAVAETAVLRAALSRQLEALGFASLPGHGNFLCTAFADSRAAHAFLLERGIILRPIEDYDLAGFLRITVGTAEQNAALVAALTEYAQSAAA